MNDNKRKNTENRDEIDLVDFSANREMDRIRENERIEREKRRRRAAEIRRAELIERRKKQRLQQMLVAWGTLILAVLFVVAAVVGIVSLFSDEETTDALSVGDEVSDAEKELVAAFSETVDAVYSKDGESVYSGLLKNTVVPLSEDSAVMNSVSELSVFARAYMWNSSFSTDEAVKTRVRDIPMLNNGYVWSTESSMKSKQSNSYYYDTHAAFIGAVCEICLWEGDTAFLGEIDTNAASDKDVSLGMSVRQKLEKAVGYYFDTSNPNGGGIRYDENDGLVYIRTLANDGTPKGAASNMFFTYKSGYLDCYNNLLFNEAMTSLSRLYKMMGDEESSTKYAEVASKNREAINNTFFDSSTGRYIGYIDIDGAKYDSGFTAVNLLAVSLGIPDKDMSQRIMSWIDGERKVPSDTLDSKNIASGVLPAFSTVAANDSSWDTLGGMYLTSSNAAFGSFWLNGGTSALGGYHELMARNALGKDKLKGQLNELCKAYEEGKYSLPTDGEMSEPSLYYSLLSSNAVRLSFGVTSEGKMLSVNPVFGHGQNIGIKNIRFARKNYSVLFDMGNVYLMCDVNDKEMIKLGGFSKKQELLVTVVQDGKIAAMHEMKADKNGCLVLSESFGESSYIKIEKK